MPSPAFAAYFEVSAETFALTMACITTGSFIARCHRSATWLHLSGLGSSLLTAFFSLYENRLDAAYANTVVTLGSVIITLVDVAITNPHGLVYWFNGIIGYECNVLGTVMGSSLSISNALALLVLFIKAQSFNVKDSRWERIRCLGLSLTAVHWAIMVASEILVDGYEVDNGLDGPRCEFVFNTTVFQLKWAAQACHQIFQAVVFIYPLRTQLMSAARARFKPSKRPSNWILFRNPLWRGVSAVSCSLVVTLIIAAFAFAKSDGALPHMPMFAVEVLHNAVNVAMVLFVVDVHQLKSIPKRTPRYPVPKLVLPARYRSHSYTGAGHGSHSFGYQNRVRGSASVGSNGRDYAVRMSSSSRVGSNGKGVMMLPPSRRYIPPVRRLPPVMDMSPESVTGGCSPSGDGDSTRSRSTPNALFFASHVPKRKWVAASTVPKASSGSRRLSRSDSSGSTSTPKGTAPKRKVAPRRAWPPPSESSARIAERWGLRRSVSSSESIGSFSDYTSSATNSPLKECHKGFQPEKIIHASRSRTGSRDLSSNSGVKVKPGTLASIPIPSKTVIKVNDNAGSDTSSSSSSSDDLPGKQNSPSRGEGSNSSETRPSGSHEKGLGGPCTLVNSSAPKTAVGADQQ